MEKTMKALAIAAWFSIAALIAPSIGEAAERASQPQISMAASAVSSDIAAHVQPG